MNKALKTPRHIAIIMDGNGRWAQKHGYKSRIFGHQKGISALQNAINGCIENNISYLTIYAFSTENWRRPTSEITALHELLDKFLDKTIKKLNNNKESDKNDIKFQTIGDLSPFNKKIQDKIQKIKKNTKQNTKFTLIVALNYGSREEITKAVRKIAKKIAKKKLKPSEINQKTIQKHLYTSKFPDPDLLIRTSGEYRISNFLLWQISYSEILILQKFWPDFKKQDIKNAITEFNKRQRRFGAI